jgi:tripartite-type tricarboxylate transporter receptor subunit TctC
MTDMNRRGLLLGTTALMLAHPALAQPAFPSRPIRTIIPFGAGGGSDNLARIIEPRVGQLLGQTLVIETRPGAGGIIGTELVAQAPPDGHTILVTDSSFTINPGLQPRLPYDARKDFVPVCLLATGSTVLLVHPSLPANSVQELVALARQRPGQLNYASGGNGTSPHLAGELLKSSLGIDLTHVPYRGTGPATNDVIAGHVPLMFNGVSAAKPHVVDGRLRALAVTGDSRNPALPDTPTFAEIGMPDFQASGHWGVYAPARTPTSIVDRLAQAFSTAVREPDLRPRLEYLGFTPVGDGPAAFKASVETEIERWTGVIRAAGIKPD